MLVLCCLNQLVTAHDEQRQSAMSGAGLYEGTFEQRRALRTALQSARTVSGLSDERLADLIMADKGAGRIPGFPKEHPARVSRATLQRYRTDAADPDLAKASPAIAGLIYNFLLQSTAVRTSLAMGQMVRSDHPLSSLMQEMMRQFGATRSQIDLAALASLEGTFHLYRKAWTSQKAATYIRTVLSFERHGDVMTYREVQHYRDTVAGLDVDEAETGLVMPFGSNIVMLGRAERTDGLKFFSIHTFYKAPDGINLTSSFGGNLIAVYGKGSHPGFRFHAVRISENEKLSCVFYAEDELDEKLCQALGVKP